MLRPGAATIADLGGLGRFTGWDGLTLTDSGGFQVFSLEPEVDDDGVTFRSHLRRLDPPPHAGVGRRDAGAARRRHPDGARRLPAAAVARPRSIRLAVERTAAWAKRARAAHDRDDQALFGIVQGGVDEALRAESARADRRARLRRLRHRRAVGGGDAGGDAPGARRRAGRPAGRPPRYLMGVGDPPSLVEAVALGVDQFDCVHADPARPPRHRPHRRRAGCSVKNARHARSDEPVDPDCGCGVCARHTRGYLRHLFQVGEPTAGRLLSLHNLAWTLELMDRCGTPSPRGRLLSSGRRSSASGGDARFGAAGG